MQTFEVATSLRPARQCLPHVSWRIRLTRVLDLKGQNCEGRGGVLIPDVLAFEVPASSDNPDNHCHTFPGPLTQARPSRSLAGEYYQL